MPETIVTAANHLLLACEAEVRAVYEEKVAQAEHALPYSTSFGEVRLEPDYNRRYPGMPRNWIGPVVIVSYLPSTGYRYFHTESYPVWPWRELAARDEALDLINDAIAREAAGAVAQAAQLVGEVD